MKSQADDAGVTYMNNEEQIRQGEEWFYSIVKDHPLTIREKIVRIDLHEEFGYHDDVYLYLDVIGESGSSIWQYPENMPLSFPMEKMQALGGYLSTLFSCPLEVKEI